jgi:hypothetical protein
VLIVPVELPPPVTLLTCQVTLVFVVPVTVAPNCLVWPPDSETAVGLMVVLTETAAVAMLMVALAVFVVSAALMAVTVTEPPVGADDGAVYKPAVEIVPTVELPPVTPFTCQLAAVLVEPDTVALNCWVLET